MPLLSVSWQKYFFILTPQKCLFIMMINLSNITAYLFCTIKWVGLRLTNRSCNIITFAVKSPLSRAVVVCGSVIHWCFLVQNTHEVYGTTSLSLELSHILASTSKPFPTLVSWSKDAYGLLI